MRRLFYLIGIGFFILFIQTDLFAQTNPVQQSLANSSCTKAWDLDLIIRDRRSSNLDTLTIGQSSAASDAIDVACGEAEIPPVPPPPTFGVNLEIPGGTTYSEIDIRNTGETVTWTIHLGGTHPFIISWDPENLPDGVFRIVDAVDGSIINENMAENTRLVIRDRSVRKVLIKRYPESNCVNLEVERGWNLLSIPVDPEDKRTANLFRSRRARAYGYSNGYSVVSQLQPGKGYWMSFGRAGTYQICGQQAGTSVDLAEGWNLIATHNADIDVSSLTTSPSDILGESVFGFTTTYVSASSFVVGKGYWVEAESAGTLTVADASKRDYKPKKYQEVYASVDSSWATISFESTDDGISQQLYIKPTPLSSVDFLDYEMPPRAPGNTFDARFGNNLQVAAIYGGPATLKFEANDSPIRVSIENLPFASIQLESVQANKPLTIIVDETRAAMIPAGYGVFRIEQIARRVSVEDAPNSKSEIEVLANYPNPFSHTSTIQFNIEQAQHVRVTLFNALGQELDVLYDKITSPGTQMIPVNGSTLPAGLYFYRVESNNFSKTHSMSIVR